MSYDGSVTMLIRKGSQGQSFSRAVISLITQLEKHVENRCITLHYFFQRQLASAVTFAKITKFSSQKIWKEFPDDEGFEQEFENKFFKRVTKTHCQLEYLFDCFLMCKILAVSQKTDEIMNITTELEPVEVPAAKVTRNIDKKLALNERHEIISKYCVFLCNIIDLLTGVRMIAEAERYYRIYIEFVKKNYSDVQFATAIFRFANYLYEHKKYQDAQTYYHQCMLLRESIGLGTDSLIDILINNALCLRMLSRYRPAIKCLAKAIQIRSDDPDSSTDALELLLAKMHFQIGEFKLAFKNIQSVYEFRKQYPDEDPRCIEIEIITLFCFSILQKIIVNPSQQLIVETAAGLTRVKKEAQEALYLFKTNLLSSSAFFKYASSTFGLVHLSLTVSKELYNNLTAYQSEELNVLLEKLNSISYNKGLVELAKTSFYRVALVRTLLSKDNPGTLFLDPFAYDNQQNFKKNQNKID